MTTVVVPTALVVSRPVSENVLYDERVKIDADRSAVVSSLGSCQSMEKNSYRHHYFTGVDPAATMQNRRTKTTVNVDYYSQSLSISSSDRLEHDSSISTGHSLSRQFTVNFTDGNEQSTSTVREISSNVGLLSLANQVYRRAMNKGFQFNLMVVGQCRRSPSIDHLPSLAQVNLAWASQRSSIHCSKVKSTAMIILQ